MQNSLFIVTIILVSVIPWSLALNYRKIKAKTHFAFGALTRQKILSKKSFEVQTLILGDSTAKSNILANKFNKETFNLARWGAPSSVETYYYLKKYLDKHAAPKCLVLGEIYSPATYKYQGFWKYSVRLSEYDNFSDFIELYNESKKVGEYPGSQYYLVEYFLRYLLYRINYLPLHPNFQADIFSMFSDEIRLFRRSRLKWNQGSIPVVGKSIVPVEIQLSTLNQFELESVFEKSLLFDHYLIRILELAAKFSIKTYYVISPIAPEIHSERAHDHLVGLYNHIKTLEYEGQQFTVLMGGTKGLDRHMYDYRHFNVQGAKKFTKWLVPKVDCGV